MTTTQWPKCPRCGTIDKDHFGACPLRRPIFKSQVLSPVERHYIDRVEAASPSMCALCSGSGQIALAILAHLGDDSPFITCPDCNGTGKA